MGVWVAVLLTGCAMSNPESGMPDLVSSTRSDAADLAGAGTCSAARTCSSGVCELDAGVCVDCLGGSDCPLKNLPVCDTATHRCVECLPAADPAQDPCPSG